jgi:hypothetical protein
VTDLSDLRRYVKTQYATGLNNTNGKPRCDAAARKAIGNGLWARICLLAAAVDSPGVEKDLRAKGEAAFVAEAGDKARVWNQSGNSEAAKMKSAWFEAAKKRAAAGGAPGEPAAKRLPPAPVVVQTAGLGGGAQDGAVLHF